MPSLKTEYADTFVADSWYISKISKSSRYLYSEACPLQQLVRQIWVLWKSIYCYYYGMSNIELEMSDFWLPDMKTLNKKLQVNSCFHLELRIDCRNNKDSRKFDVCWDFFIFIYQLFTNFHGFIASVGDCWRIHLRNINYMVVSWILCSFNKWDFDFFSKCPICKFSNYWWDFIMLRKSRLVFFWFMSSFNFI